MKSFCFLHEHGSLILIKITLTGDLPLGELHQIITRHCEGILHALWCKQQHFCVSKGIQYTTGPQSESRCNVQLGVDFGANC